MKIHDLIAGLSLLTSCCFAAFGQTMPAKPGNPTTQVQGNSSAIPWKDGFLGNGQAFPIGVWLQNPRNAARYKAAGINVYVGLWHGPTKSQLDELAQAGMAVICDQNRVGLEQRSNPIIVGWMHGDEPDNAQSLGTGKGYGPPILPEKIVENYARIRTADPSRPVLLNLGQGVAWDNYIGRGVRRNHPEDYPQYLLGCDIASFDIYPVVHDSPEIAGKLEFVAHGVQRLMEWTKGEKFVWNCIECSHISNPQVKATPAQVRSEVWMSLIHGSRGLIYFVHQFKPVFREASLLEDPSLLAAITTINRQIHELTPALQSPSVTEGVTVTAPEQPSLPVGANSSRPGATPSSAAPIAWMCKRMPDRLYLFAVNMRNRTAQATLTVPGYTGDSLVEALGETRQIPARDGTFADVFEPYGVHLYSFQASLK